ncbi:unnamed protein product [Closterium sp. Naga37s-1]|nr:unnamed protein product [Closterium sp. Naga37s-1]
MAGYTEIDGACTAACSPPCREGATCQVDSGVSQCKCDTDAGYTMMDGGQCKRSNAPVADPCGGTCVGDRQCMQGVCECKAGYTEIDGACTVAAPCGGTCKANQQCMNGVCKCKEGYTEMDGACTATSAPVADPCGGTCKGNRECMQGACTCKEGYTEMDGACTGELKKKGLEVAHGCSAVRQRPMPHSHLTLSSLSPHSHLTLSSLLTLTSLSPHSLLTLTSLSPHSHSVTSLSLSPVSVHIADPCGGTCGETRECVQGVCECKAGYTEIDGLCTGLNAPVADPCGGIVCEGNRECVPTNGQGVCECMAGYTEIDGACTAHSHSSHVCHFYSPWVISLAQTPPFHSNVPPNVPLAPLIPPTRPVPAVCSPACSLYASCQVANGTAVCVCDAGYTMLDNGECTPACSPPCSAETTCQVENGIGVCKCNAGYTLLSNGQCKGECRGRAFSLFPSLMSQHSASSPPSCLSIQPLPLPHVSAFSLFPSLMSQHSASSPPSCPLPVPQPADPLVPLAAVCNPACKAKAECVVVGGDSVCRCKQGYMLKKKRCMRRGGQARRRGA